jgi:hypothetical protein
VGGGGGVGDRDPGGEAEPAAQGEQAAGKALLAAEQVRAGADVEPQPLLRHDRDERRPVAGGMRGEAVEIGGDAVRIGRADIEVRHQRAGMGQRHAGAEAERLGMRAGGGEENAGADAVGCDEGEFLLFVIPVEAGTHELRIACSSDGCFAGFEALCSWIPVFAGRTIFGGDHLPRHQRAQRPPLLPEGAFEIVGGDARPLSFGAAATSGGMARNGWGMASERRPISRIEGRWWSGSSSTSAWIASRLVRRRSILRSSHWSESLANARRAASRRNADR